MNVKNIGKIKYNYNCRVVGALFTINPASPVVYSIFVHQRQEAFWKAFDKIFGDRSTCWLHLQNMLNSNINFERCDTPSKSDDSFAMRCLQLQQKKFKELRIGFILVNCTLLYVYCKNLKKASLLLPRPLGKGVVSMVPSLVSLQTDNLVFGPLLQPSSCYGFQEI